MFKKILCVAALVVACSPAFVSAQGFQFSFDGNSITSDQTVPDSTSSGTLYIFGDGDLDFNQADLNFDHDNGGVLSLTGGRVYNPGAAGSGTQASTSGGAFTSFDLDQLEATGGRIFATSFLSPGQVPGSGAANFRAGANAFLLAEVDFDIVGAGTANFTFDVGPLGVVNDGVGQINPTLGTGSLTVEGDTPVVPEPSSAILLILGAAGMAARRRRS